MVVWFVVAEHVGAPRQLHDKLIERRERRSEGSRVEPIEVLTPSEQQLSYGGRKLDDRDSVRSCNMQKESTLFLMKAGRQSAPSRCLLEAEEVSEEEDAEVAAEAEEMQACVQGSRPHPLANGARPTATAARKPCVLGGG